ncbi:MAG: hypothetical protein V1856_01650 [Candidatus Liptonbacteria bacterium]
MLNYTDLKRGVIFLYEGQPYEVIEANFLRMQQRKAVVSTKIQNLATGKILDRTWQASDSFEEIEVERKKAIYIYTSKGARPQSPERSDGGRECWFHEAGDKSKRFMVKEEVIGTPAQFMRANTEVITLMFGEKVLNVEVPIKMTLEVKEAPPGVKGNTAQGGTKQVVLETGAMVNTPLFVNEGDKIVVNTSTGEYVERA